MRRLLSVLSIGVMATIEAPMPNAALVEGMVQRAEDLAYVEAFAPARLTLEHAIDRAASLGNRRLMALSLDRLGSVLAFGGDATAGLERHQRALALARDLHDQATIASVLASIGLTHWRQGEYQEALTRLHEALTIQETLDDAVGAARTHVFIGRVHFKKAAYDTAKTHYMRAVSLLEPSGNRRWLSIALEDLGDLALERGFFTEGIDHLQRSLDARRAIGDVGGEVYMLTVIGRAYLQQGAYREAFSWFDRGVRQSQTADARPSRGLAFYHLGIACYGIGEHAKALDAYAQALAIKEELADRRQQAWILSRIGDVHASDGDHVKALAAYRRATGIWEAIGDPRGTAGGLAQVARASLETGDYETALASYRRAADLYGKGQPAFTASALSGMARVYAASGDESAALEHARQAAALARGGPDDVRWVALRTLGSIERQFGHRAAAVKSLDESLAIIESLRGRVVPSADVRADFLEGKQAAYAEMVALLVELGRDGEALEFAERARARAFLELLAARAGTSLSGAPALTLQQTRNEVRRRDVTAIEYFSTADRLFVWVLQPDGGIHARSQEIPRRDLSRRVDEMRTALTRFQDVRAHLRELNDILIAPIDDLLPDDRDRLITIVPHGPLFLVSFAALVDSDGRYLVERHTLSYSPSLSVLPYTARNRARIVATVPRVLTVGNPLMPDPRGGQPALTQLPGAEHEARAIGALYRDSPVVSLVGAQAGERAIRDVAADQTILHFATHAVLFDDEPRASYLALTADATADGFLTVDEVLGLNLRADLVTLSACNTGLGRISGEGVVGLSRAFIYAGAASVLVSLWSVADAVASVQMERFYQGVIATHGDKASALASAQREIIRQLREGRIVSPGGRKLEEHPVFWAPFVLIGEPR